MGDPLTLKCIEPWNCPIGFYIDTVNKLCVKECSAPYWANLDTRFCMLYCEWNPPSYESWKDPSTRKCVEQCPKNPMTFSDNDTQSCVSVCAEGYFGSVLTYECVKTCPDGYHSEMDSNLCVSDCTTNDITILYYFGSNTTCISACPEEYFADDTTLSCVESCPVETYGYEVDNKCLSGCPNGLYADNHSQLCV